MSRQLQVFGHQPGPFGDPAEHAPTKLLSVVKSKDEVRPSLALKGAMRAALSLDRPPDSHERRQDTAGAG
jgi:hypothetical protein